MRYLIIRPAGGGFYAIIGQFELTPGIQDHNLRTGGYVPAETIKGGDEILFGTQTVRNFIDDNFETLTRDLIPVLKCENSVWEFTITVTTARMFRLSQFIDEFQTTLQSFISRERQITTMAVADLALYRLVKVFGRPYGELKGLMIDFLSEEENARWFVIGGHHNWDHLLRHTSLRRVISAFGLDPDDDTSAVLKDFRLAFAGLFLGRILDEERRLVDRYRDDLEKTDDIAEIFDCHLPNTIKPR